MADYTSLKAELVEEQRKTQRQIDWLSGHDDTQTWNFTWTIDSDGNTENYSYTGTGGGTSYWNAWRSDNPDVSSGVVYEMWNDWINNGGPQFDGSETLTEHVARMQGIIDGFQEQIDHIDAQIAAGITDSEGSAPVGDPPPPVE